MIEQKCQNPDEPCGRLARRRFHGLRLCVMCCKRFERHGDGKKMAPWRLQMMDDGSIKKDDENA